MAAPSKLSEQAKCQVIQALAYHDTHADIIGMLKEQYGIEMSPAGISRYDAETVNGKLMPKRYQDLFWEERKKFDAGKIRDRVESRAFRARMIRKIAVRSYAHRNDALALQALAQAAKEEGGHFKGRQAETGNTNAAAAFERIWRAMGSKTGPGNTNGSGAPDGS